MRLPLLVLLANLAYLNADPGTLSISAVPTFFPTVLPTFSLAPTISSAPSEAPTVKPTKVPTIRPTRIPTQLPTVLPTDGPTVKPTVQPSIMPTQHPTVTPTIMPTVHPTVIPTVQPSHHPTITGPGWLLETYFTNETSADALVVYGTRTEQCLAFYRGTEVDYEEVYYKFSCGEEYIQFQIYSDEDCTNAIHQADISLDFTHNGPMQFSTSYFDGSWYYRVMPEVTYGTIQCVQNGGQYDFTEFTDGLKYAVTEFFPQDDTVPEDDQFYQCHTDYTQFAAYMKGYCFQVDYHEYDFEDDDLYHSNYYKFSASDTTFISLTSFDDNQCSYQEEGDFWVENIFAVDDCKTNLYQGSFYDNAHKKEATSPAKAKAAKSASHVPYTFKFDKTTPTLVRQLMDESLAQAQNKKVVPLPAALNAKNAAKKAERASKKDTEGLEHPYYATEEQGNIYFEDDHYGYYFYDDEFGWDDDNYYNYALPGPTRWQYLSQFYLWKNVPDLETTNPPDEWFTEVIYDYQETPMIFSTRATLTCMPFTKQNHVEFNYQVVCENDFVHVMYFGWQDVNCETDYKIASFPASWFFNTYSPQLGAHRYFYEFSEAEVFCSNTMFSSEWAAAIEENAYATEFFYPVTSYDSDSEEYSSECTTQEDAILGVAIIEDYCMNIYVDYYNFLNIEQQRTVSVKYWVDEDNNNQNIQMSIWQAPGCNGKFIKQTKEVEINTCYDYQPNTWYLDAEKGGRRSLRQSENNERETSATHHAIDTVTRHDSNATPFGAKVLEMAPKGVRKSHAKKQAAKKSAKKTTETATPQKNDKKTKWTNPLTPYYYYYYYQSDDAATTLNNRPSAMKNEWFTIPTSPTIHPTVHPTVKPTRTPTIHPSEAPSEQPTVQPSVQPSIMPTMAPNPPTLRPTPSAGSPTASPSHQVTYTFSVTQTLNGINATVFLSNENNTYAFAEAVAMAVPPLTTDNIYISNVVDVVTERRKLSDGEDAVDITYWLTYTVAETGYHDAETAYTALINSLTTAIVDTDLFDGYIWVVAQASRQNAPDLLDTTTESFTNTEATQVGTDDDSKPATKSHHKVLVGVLVGLGGGLLFIGMIAMCIWGPFSTRKNETA